MTIKNAGEVRRHLLLGGHRGTEAQKERYFFTTDSQEFFFTELKECINLYLWTFSIVNFQLAI